VRIIEKALLTDEQLGYSYTERLILGAVDHPNILKIKETFQDEKCMYIVTEICQGGELYQKIVDHNSEGTIFTEHEAAVIINHVLSAMRYMHDNNLILMDLKPENILFASKSNLDVKLIDFRYV
jgi:calcium-dependent protein kinase